MFGCNNDRLFPEKYTVKDHISNTKIEKGDHIRLFFLAMRMTGQVRANRHHVFAQSLRHNGYFSLKLAIYS